MKTVTFNTAREFNKFFNFNLQPSAIKSVNGITVNVFNGTLIYNELKVTNNNVTVESYYVAKQGYTRGSFKAPFVVEY